MAKLDDATKRKKIIIKQDVPLLNEYADLYIRAKYLEKYMEMARATLLRILFPQSAHPSEPDKDTPPRGDTLPVGSSAGVQENEDEANSRVKETEVKFSGSEDAPPLYVAKIERKALLMPRKVTPELEAFLRDKNAEQLIYLSSPSSSLYVRGSPKLNEQIAMDAGRDFIGKYKEFTGFSISVEIDIHASERLARDCWETRRELMDAKKKMESMKPMLRASLPEADTASYHYPRNGYNFIINVQHNPGGVKMISSVQFANVFGESAIIGFGAERTRVNFRIETEKERARRLEQKNERDKRATREAEERKAFIKERDRLTLERLSGHMFGPGEDKSDEGEGYVEFDLEF